MTVGSTTIVNAITVSLHDLETDQVPLETLHKAFGTDSLGILIVKDVSPEFVHLRSQALSYASYLANLPESELKKLENPEAKFLTGWSLGKERLKDGQIDTHKGSFYANCAFYADPSLNGGKPTAHFTAKTFPEYIAPNKWPSETGLPGFKHCLETLVRLMIDTALLVARACDTFAEKEISNYPRGYVEHVVRTSTTTKARLLHYYPLAGHEPLIGEEDDRWCTTHLDHGCLTALTSAMFIDEETTPCAVPQLQPGKNRLPSLEELPTSPDPKAGLYIKSRSGDIVQVKIPRDCIAFQTGETLERITQGRFKAVPHFVSGIRPTLCRGRIARNTLAVFTQPNLEDEVDIEQHINFGEFSRGIVARNTVS